MILDGGMKISLVTPAGPKSRNGNRKTAVRWARFLEQLGYEVVLGESWGGEDSDILISLHARRSYPSIRDYAAAHPDRPLVLVLTGTDLYRDISRDADARESMDLATTLVLLQEAGLLELDPPHRAKACVIYQSAEPINPQPPAKRFFDVCVIGHLRAEKDPFRTALAADLLPDTSRIRVTHVGGARSEGFAEQAMSHMENEPRYRWLGELPHWKVRRLLSRTRLLVQSSVMEGGANTISEALAAGVPVIASEISGNVGMLGEDYPGYYPVGDEYALAQLLERTETEPEFYARLVERCEARRYLVLPEREKMELDRLIKRAVRQV